MTSVDVLVWAAIGLKFATGFILIGLGIYGHRFRRITRRARRSVEAERAADARVAAWRSERRSRRVSELRAWDRDFAALLPPPPPCTSTDHNHVENIRLGSGTIETICVIRPPYSRGGAILSPGEHVMSQREIARQLGVGGITVEQAVEAMRRLAR
jgi:hypothetical protein